MRRAAILTLSVLVLAACAPTDADARAPSLRCFPRDAYEHAASTRVRLYEVSARDDVDHRRLFVCDLVTGRRTEVAEAFDVDESIIPSHFRFAGRTIAFVLEHCLKTECDSPLVAIDARTGRTPTAGPAARRATWALSPGGALAWVEYGPPLRLKSSTGRSQVTVEDEGDGIDPRSLAFADGGRLYRIRDGQPRSTRVGFGPRTTAVTDPRGKAACYPRGARALGSTTRVRVFALDRNSIETVVACELRSGRRTELTSAHQDDHPGINVLRIRGPFVAFAASACVKGDCHYGGPQVVDTKTGRAPYEVADLSHGQRVRELVLAENGSIAWIAGDVPVTVARCDSRGCGVIASENGFGTGELALSDAGHLYWTSGTETRSADLR